jgi:hypothetical protein
VEEFVPVYAKGFYRKHRVRVCESDSPPEWTWLSGWAAQNGRNASGVDHAVASHSLLCLSGMCFTCRAIVTGGSRTRILVEEKVRQEEAERGAPIWRITGARHPKCPRRVSPSLAQDSTPLPRIVGIEGDCQADSRTRSTRYQPGASNFKCHNVYRIAGKDRISRPVDGPPTIARSPGGGLARGATDHGHVASRIGRPHSRQQRVRGGWAEQ